MKIRKALGAVAFILVVLSAAVAAPGGKHGRAESLGVKGKNERILLVPSLVSLWMVMQIPWISRHSMLSGFGIMCLE